MNTITPLNPNVKPDDLAQSPQLDAPTQPSEAAADQLDYPNYTMPAFEVEQPSTPQPTFNTSPTPVAPAAPQPSHAPASFNRAPVPERSMTLIASSGFLMKYIASLFAGISVLSGLSSLGFILLDHFINKPEGVTLGNMFDASTFVSTWHVWLVASLLTFVTLYLILSRAAGKYLADENASEREIQVAEVARSIFTAVLVIVTAYLFASLLFTLLNSTLAAAEIEGKDIAIQVAGSILAFIWIGVIIKHQTSVHVIGKNGLAGVILAIAAVSVAVLASIFLLAAGRNAVIDSRTISDLSTIQSELSTYEAKNNSYPDNLDLLAIDDEKIKGRLSKYTYTRTQAPAQSSFEESYEDMMSSRSTYSSMRDFSAVSSPKTGYKLCATFLTDASSKASLYGGSAEQSGVSSSTFYSHGKGEHCVERDV